MENLEKPSLPFKIDSIIIINTGLSDVEIEIESVLWIDSKRIGIKNGVECIFDDGFGGTCLSIAYEFDWSLKERDIYNDAYALIVLSNEA